MSQIFDIAVIGGGLAGLTAANHASSFGGSVLHVMGDDVPGGLAANVGVLEGFPSAGPVAAMDIAVRLMEDNAERGVTVEMVKADRVERDGDAFKIASAEGSWLARRVIAATGARLKSLDAPGAAEFWDRGVSNCAWCNGALYKGAEVVVVGGGDAALQEALHLAQFAEQITLVTRGERFRARPSFVDKVAAHEKFQFRWESEVAEITGADGVTGVKLIERGSGQTEEIPCAGVFVYIGQTANAEMLPDAVERDAAGFVVTSANCETSMPGLYAVGAVRSGFSGRLSSAVGEASAAAVAAARSLEE